MKKLLYMTLLASGLSILAACNDDFLDRDPLTEFPSDDVFSDPALLEAFINDTYRGLGHGLYEIMMSSHTDESQFIHNYGSQQVVSSILTPADLGSWGDWRMHEYQWDNAHVDGFNENGDVQYPDNYNFIRRTNIFLEEIGESPVEDEELKKRLKGEAHFLRAYFYHNLWRLYGGVPLVTRSYDLDDDYIVSRNTFAETVDFIVAECDSAAALLPLTPIEGRAGQGAALALKSRVLLYAASDLYHNTNWAQGYSNPEFIGYVGADRTAMWQAAKDAAKAVMDLGIYGLYGADPAPDDSTAENYANIFLEKTNEEAILSRFFMQIRDDGYNPGLHNGPNGYHNWGGNTPIQNLVDDYEMADGTKFDWNNPAHAAAPYENRDPRFYASILYDGAPWRERPSDVQDLDPVGVIQIARRERRNSSGNIVVAEGLDTRQGPIEDWNGTYSGYYLRKFIDKDIDAQFFKQEVPWRFFRYAEIVLNYAEACIGLGQENEAREYINMIRRRAGMPEVTDAGQDLLARYQNERRVELAFEEHRYFDVRRWMIAPQELSENAYGIRIYAALNSNNSYTYTYERQSIQDRGWNDRLYFLPIPMDEMNRNDQLVQNPGY